MAKNPLIRKYPKRINTPQPNKSAGILDDFAVRSNVATKSGTVLKAPVDDIDVVNKKYVDDHIPPASGAAGNDTEVQYNDSGAFAASSDFVWDNAVGPPKELKITGKVIATDSVFCGHDFRLTRTDDDNWIVLEPTTNGNLRIGEQGGGAINNLYIQSGHTRLTHGDLIVDTMTIDGGSITDSTGDITFGNENLSTTGLGTFGNLDVDTLNFNGNVITDSTGTISFGDENLTTTGTINNAADDSQHTWGAAGAADSYIQFGGTNLEFFSAGDFDFSGSSILSDIADTQVVFSDSGKLAGDAGLTYNSGTGTLSATEFVGGGAGLTGLASYWDRTGTVLSPLTDGDDVTLSDGSGVVGTGTVSSTVGFQKKIQIVEDVVPAPIPVITASVPPGYSVIFTSGSQTGMEYTIVTSFDGIPDYIRVAESITGIGNGDTFNIIAPIIGTMTATEIVGGTITANTQVDTDVIDSINGVGITFADDIDGEELDFLLGTFNQVDTKAIDATNTIQQVLLTTGDTTLFNLDLEYELLGGTLNNKFMLRIQGDSIKTGGTFTNDWGIKIEDHSSDATNQYGLALSSDDVDWGAIWFGAGQDAKIYYDGTDMVINPKEVGTGSLNVLGDITTTGTIKGANYKSGDGSAGITQSETGVTDFDIVIKNGLITSFTKNA